MSHCRTFARTDAPWSHGRCWRSRSAVARSRRTEQSWSSPKALALIRAESNLCFQSVLAITSGGERGCEISCLEGMRDQVSENVCVLGQHGNNSVKHLAAADAAYHPGAFEDELLRREICAFQEAKMYDSAGRIQLQQSLPESRYRASRLKNHIVPIMAIQRTVFPRRWIIGLIRCNQGNSAKPVGSRSSRSDWIQEGNCLAAIHEPQDSYASNPDHPAA